MTQSEIIKILEERFADNMERHEDIDWVDVLVRIESNPSVLETLINMETTDGMPDVVGVDEVSGGYIFMDCSPETPEARRNTTYDLEGEKARNKKGVFPNGNALSMAADIGIKILDETEYVYLQTKGIFDVKTSSWIDTPPSIRDLGGALFSDRRYDHIFVYHNGAQSFYSSRGFRGLLIV